MMDDAIVMTVNGTEKAQYNQNFSDTMLEEGFVGEKSKKVVLNIVCLFLGGGRYELGFFLREKREGGLGKEENSKKCTKVESMKLTDTYVGGKKTRVRMAMIFIVSLSRFEALPMRMAV